MNITELIEKLEKVKKNNGECEVYLDEHYRISHLTTVSISPDYPGEVYLSNKGNKK